MKYLSLTQPWATLVAIGAKRIETRSWATSYRGPLRIHASKIFPRWAQDLCRQEPYRTALGAGGYLFASQLPLSQVIAECILAGCIPITVDMTIGEPECSFGDYTPGRHMLPLHDIRRLEKPIPARGALGLWEWSEAHAIRPAAEGARR